MAHVIVRPQHNDGTIVSTVSFYTMQYYQTNGSYGCIFKILMNDVNE